MEMQVSSVALSTLCTPLISDALRALYLQRTFAHIRGRSGSVMLQKLSKTIIKAKMTAVRFPFAIVAADKGEDNVAACVCGGVLCC